MKLPSLAITFGVWALVFFLKFAAAGAEVWRTRTAVAPGDRLWWTMVVVMAGLFVLMAAGAAVLVWQAGKRRTWAAWGVTAIAAWMLYDFAGSVFWAVARWASPAASAYPTVYGLSSWQWDAIYLLLWLNMAYAAHRQAAPAAGQGTQAETISN